MALCECPRCGALMEEGKIEQERGLAAWTPIGKRKSMLFPVISGDSIIISNPNRGPVFGSEVRASLCKKCKMIIIDVSDFIE